MIESIIEKIKDGVIEGIGFSLGLLLIFGVIFSVYAFVEPSSGPSSNYVIDWSSPLNILHQDTNDKITDVNTTVNDMSSTVNVLHTDTNNKVTDINDTVHSLPYPKVEWAGYTSSTYTGSMGGIKGMNNYCHSEYSGSHACTHDEIIKLGNSYPNTYSSWVIDGSYPTGTSQITKDGQFYSTLGGADSMCGGWSLNTNSFAGPAYSSTSSFLWLAACNSNYRIPCCR